MAVMKTMKIMMAKMMTIIVAVATVAKLTTGFRKTSTTVPFELGSPDPTLGVITMILLFVGCFGGAVFSLPPRVEYVMWLVPGVLPASWWTPRD